VVQPGQTVTVQVLEIDRDKRRISLGLKQCQDNPWEAFAKSIHVGDKVSGTVRSTTDFGVFVALTDEIDGLVHVSDLSWEQSGEEALRGYKKGDKVEAVVLAIDTAKERVALGIKQLSGDPLAGVADSYKKGDVVDVKVTEVDNDSITVTLDGMEAVIKSRDLGAGRDDQDPSRFKEGDTVKAKVTMLSKKDRKLSLSIRALEQDEERATVKSYANQSDGGNDAMAEALKKATAKAAAKPKAEKAPAKKAAKAEAAEGEEAPKAKKAPAKKAKKAE
jgi:small subunit ribosomal protein S1